MKVLNDFVCRNGHKHEALLPMGQKETWCPICGEVSEKALSAPAIKLEGWSGHFPGRAMKWEREHMKAGAVKS
jgi:hypothetical protein